MALAEMAAKHSALARTAEALRAMGFEADSWGRAQMSMHLGANRQRVYADLYVDGTLKLNLAMNRVADRIPPERVRECLLVHLERRADRYRAQVEQTEEAIRAVNDLPQGPA